MNNPEKKLIIVDYLNDKISEVLDNETLTYQDNILFQRNPEETDAQYSERIARLYSLIIQEAHLSLDAINTLCLDISKIINSTHT